MASHSQVRLVPATVPLLEALVRDRAELGELLGSPVPDGPEFPEAIAFTLEHLAAASESDRPWSMQLFVEEDTGRLIGSGGFATPPQDRTVEIGYEIAPEFRGRGLGAASARALVDAAVASGAVDTVTANTLAGPNPSTGVLVSLGFTHVGEQVDPEAGPVWSWTWSRGDAQTGEMVEHYESHLAQHYDWMLGDLRVAVNAQVELLRPLLEQVERGSALDLGCGTGLHTLALGELGFGPVTCLDTSATMLRQLVAHASGRVEVETLEADLTAGLPAGAVTGGHAVAVCMGDTLTHFPDEPTITSLLGDVRRALRPGGVVVLTFRDLTTTPEGNSRFLPVRSDADTIFTCFLEDQGSHVRVHDLVHTRSADGTWNQQVSSYLKLKLAPARVAEMLGDAGLVEVVTAPGPRGLWVVTAVRPTD